MHILSLRNSTTANVNVFIFLEMPHTPFCDVGKDIFYRHIHTYDDSSDAVDCHVKRGKDDFHEQIIYKIYKKPENIHVQQWFSN